MTDTHVLFVEDSDFMAARVSETLESAHEFDVTRVETAAAARSTFEGGGNGIDCVVSSYELPDETGPNLAASLADEPSVDVPFILFTGQPLAPLAGDALEAGVTDFVSKDQHVSGEMDVLANRIRLAIEARRETQIP